MNCRYSFSTCWRLISVICCTGGMKSAWQSVSCFLSLVSCLPTIYSSKKNVNMKDLAKYKFIEKPQKLRFPPNKHFTSIFKNKQILHLKFLLLHTISHTTTKIHINHHCLNKIAHLFHVLVQSVHMSIHLGPGCGCARWRWR